MSEFYNDGGVPHGAFIAIFNSAQALKVENFNLEDPGKVINRGDEIGSPNGWAGVDDQETATGTVQIKDNTGSALRKGDFFVDASARRSFKWVVVGKGERYAAGDYWKEEVRFQRARLS